MVLNRVGQVFEYEDKTYIVGEEIYSNDLSEYKHLFGRITEIRTDEDRETENDTPDIYCTFEQPALTSEYEKLREAMSGIEDIAFDLVIMSPEMIIPLRLLLPEEKHLKIFALIEDCTVDYQDSDTLELFTDIEKAKLKTWMMPNQKEELIGTYSKLLISKGDAKTAAKLMPGIRFMTSDTGISSAKVSALLLGSQHPIHIGGCIEVDHRHQRTVDEFEKALDQLFAQYEDGIKRLEALANVHLDYPVNAMTRVCKKLSMPKKAALAAISIFEMVCGSGTATAHDVFLAMQEIPFNMKCDGTPEAKMIALEENMARALRLNWKEYDLAKAVEY